MSPTPRSLILDLLSTLRRGSMPVRALVEAGALFELDGNGVRVALARLVASGLVESDGPGTYRMGDNASSVLGQVASWRATESRLRPWKQGWIGVHTATVPRSDRRSRRKMERALRFLGFRELDRGLEVRPDNLAGGVSAVRDRLQELGLDQTVAVFGMSDLDDDRARRAVRLWDVEALAEGYRRTLATLAASTKKLPDLDVGEAMVESFLVGGAALRQIVLDPLLPDAIMPSDGRRELVGTMRRYDKLGRACWAPFMRSHAIVTHNTAPSDARAIDAAEAMTMSAMITTENNG